MVEKIWFENHWLGVVLWPILWPLSCLYQKISESRKRDFEAGAKPRYRAPVPVVVVGNITAGGNGKTPMVVWLVEQLQQMGLNPGVVSRGYGAKAPKYPYLVSENSNPEHCGDEPLLIHRRTHAPVAVDPVRSNAVKALVEQGVDVVVTDDGLQHYALERDIEIAVVDGKRRMGNEKLIPMGPLREPVSRLESVDFIVTNGGEPKSQEIAMTLEPALAKNLVTGETLNVLDLESVVAMAGIGHPPRFFNTLKRLGVSLKAEHGFADHQKMTEGQITEIEMPSTPIIMTEKDAVKCLSFAKDNWWYLPVSAELADQNAERILQRIKEVMKDYGSSTA
ncbi:tetraacyldisaccharide 4'-kinase [Vibrio nigripulchritudo]|uniref:tetraacyldisaccharide 4'-kinase n=1 Tax=Vibrio nigripulchritudo TaxID=28173 RepID=UPI0024922295|nr:tetraacyldisaccharide 4'-kinase [Vibrio nigripulchritudo]BDU37755.1 tetraacyldisaccharide 4'-kinase [Vibrio nigripulchritudo]BDU43475.1 tetraacyldisaccharide 4'-kinase [Vibrio nigripulchritudo]